MKILMHDFNRLRKTLRHRADSEHEQAMVRIGMVAMMTIWFMLAPHTGLIGDDGLKSGHAVTYALMYLVVAAMTFLMLLRRPEVNPRRRIFWLVADPVIFGSIFLVAGKAAVPLSFIFVWLPIDNGFRFGRKYLFASLSISLFMLGMVVHKQYYWGGHAIIAAGILLEVLLVCTYTAIPIGRLNAANVKLVKMATRDPLTGLANRQLFIDHLQNAMALTERNGKYCACVFIDLDGFKQVNDTHGHAIGDLLLNEVSKRITGSLRETDLVARLGGDEFAVTAQCFHIPVDAIMVSGRILKSISTIQEIAGKKVDISASIGVSWYQYSEGCTMSVEALIDHADKAMYAAKKGGKNCIRVVGIDGFVKEPQQFSLQNDKAGA